MEFLTLTKLRQSENQLYFGVTLISISILMLEIGLTLERLWEKGPGSG